METPKPAFLWKFQNTYENCAFHCFIKIGDQKAGFTFELAKFQKKPGLKSKANQRWSALFQCRWNIPAPISSALEKISAVSEISRYAQRWISTETALFVIDNFWIKADQCWMSPGLQPCISCFCPPDQLSCFLFTRRH